MKKSETIINGLAQLDPTNITTMQEMSPIKTEQPRIRKERSRSVYLNASSHAKLLQSLEQPASNSQPIEMPKDSREKEAQSETKALSREEIRKQQQLKNKPTPPKAAEKPKVDQEKARPESPSKYNLLPSSCKIVERMQITPENHATMTCKS